MGWAWESEGNDGHGVNEDVTVKVQGLGWEGEAPFSCTTDHREKA